MNVPRQILGGQRKGWLEKLKRSTTSWLRRRLALTLLVALLVGCGTLWVGSLEAQTKIEAGDTATISGWILTDEQLIDVTHRLESLQDSTAKLVTRALYADSLSSLLTFRVTQCRSVLAATDTVLDLALKNRGTIWDKIPDWIYFGLGVYIGSKVKTN